MRLIQTEFRYCKDAIGIYDIVLRWYWRQVWVNPCDSGSLQHKTKTLYFLSVICRKYYISPFKTFLKAKIVFTAPVS